MFEGIDVDGIDNPELKKLVVLLLNGIEQELQRNRVLTEEVQLLRDEIARLKGGNPKPRFPSSKTRTNHSSEQERSEPKRWHKKSKQDQLSITRTVPIDIPVSELPSDAKFKGWERYYVQELHLVTEVICYKRAKYYSASAKKTYLAPLPPGCVGHFGPNLRSTAVDLAYAGNMSHAGVHTFLSDTGILISAGQVNNLLVNGQEALHANSREVTIAGLASSVWQHTDHTPTRVNGKNQNCQVLCNPLYSAFRTAPSKDRLAILRTLLAGSPFTYLCDSAALAYLQNYRMGRRLCRRIEDLFPEQNPLSEEQFSQRLEAMADLGPRQRKIVREALAISGYHVQTEVPVIKMLLCDDAPQFNFVTDDLSLCWVHDARNYKKLNPVVCHNRTVLNAFMTQYWKLYKALNTYRSAPTPEEAKRLEAEFDALFSTVTDYQELNERIARTRANKEQLLQVLNHPEILLHNNPAELAARRRVRKRDVSFGPRSDLGLQAWDTFMTLSETARKLGVSFLHYLQDELSEKHNRTSLADMIRLRATLLNLNTSWDAG
jgi:hypothetical protein